MRLRVPVRAGVGVGVRVRRLARFLVVAALGGAGVLACGAAEAAGPLPVGPFDPVGGHGGGVIAGGGEWEHAEAGDGAR
ncbi:hypothetical protein ADL22_07590 [Streptomyces sp. NRRL F-4489]|uniref:hypothetical protein n=1 Tax=Streptomyces sp. NRRL F-4489 TaxID=1609095 RepID=UPI0007488C38|nr:hypothetical protein [Streptomyces sp. NRRL F-4489]KUL50129.1 hypothetical protein ADL22_07590 [Streptomyces sp. NRRL F-4489]